MTRLDQKTHYAANKLGEAIASIGGIEGPRAENHKLRAAVLAIAELALDLPITATPTVKAERTHDQSRPSP